MLVKFLNKFVYIVLIVLITSLALDYFFVIEFSETHKSIAVFITFLLLTFTIFKELITGKGFLKFLCILILLSVIVGGIISITTGQVSYFMYFSLLLTLIYSIIILTC